MNDDERLSRLLSIYIPLVHGWLPIEVATKLAPLFPYQCNNYCESYISVIKLAYNDIDVLAVYLLPVLQSSGNSVAAGSFLHSTHFASRNSAYKECEWVVAKKVTIYVSAGNLAWFRSTNYLLIWPIRLFVSLRNTLPCNDSSFFENPYDLISNRICISTYVTEIILL